MTHFSIEEIVADMGGRQHDWPGGGPGLSRSGLSRLRRDASVERVFSMPAARVRDMTERALANGAVLHTPYYATWGASAGCECPRVIRFAGYGHRIVQGDAAVSDDGSIRRPVSQQAGYWEHARDLSMLVRCRRCGKCLWDRSVLWRSRMEREFRASHRTWMGTLTVQPSTAHRCLLLTIDRLRDKGVDYNRLDPDERFREKAYDLYHELVGGKGFWQRLRDFPRQQSERERVARFTRQPVLPRSQVARLTFRYVVIVEPHDGGGEKDGEPHFHVLVHEQAHGSKVTSAAMTQAWYQASQGSFSSFKVVKEARAIRYVAKYLAKDARCRIRSSVRYGAVGEPLFANWIPPVGPPPSHKVFEAGLAQVMAPPGSEPDQDDVGHIVVSGDGEDLGFTRV